MLQVDVTVPEKCEPSNAAVLALLKLDLESLVLLF
jgi:hypothetical protein